MWNVGTDTGGTFTDLVAIDVIGRMAVSKTPSTPPDFEVGVSDALREAGIPPEDVRLFYHGTTVTTNALITRTGAATGLVTTEGFRDVLEIRRGNREDLYDILWDSPAPLVPRYNRLEVRERLNYRGEVTVPLDEDDVIRAARIFRKRGIESVAIALINSYANASHEQAIRQILRDQLPHVYLSVSSEIVPEPPEFERSSTTVANAYVGPVLTKYIENLGHALEAVGSKASILIMHSGGGTLTPASALRVPVRTATSGPAAGVMAAAAVARQTGRQHVVSLDMGGTSADIATIHEGNPRLTFGQSVEWGMPIMFPCVDLVTIGAGGGSIAWLDAARIPHCGPQSAGAHPGPACYGRGGRAPTNTDANLVLGRLRPSTFLGGRLSINASLAKEAVARDIAEPLALTLLNAAAGIIRISNENMANAIRYVTVQRGLDPREFALVAFGGAGPMHAVELARELQIPEVVVPLSPGATSALGLLCVDARHDMVRTHIAEMGRIDFDDLEALYAEMEGEARAILDREGFGESEMRLERMIDLRYAGQVRALTISVEDGRLGSALLDRAVADFHDEYEREFRYSIPKIPVESRALRVSAVGATAKPPFEKHLNTRGTLEDATVGKEPVYFDDGAGLVSTCFYDRNRLPTGVRISGPAIVEQYDSTTVIPPSASATLDQFGNFIICVGA